ncbi:hypothetical protein RUM43_000343 [Polyplax serrata]|uniref:Uncharacterized protein n=1 Tax=Polyplax serrata TaxID=468196 RepID=A0AAN8XMZ9_POLSC
MLEREREGFVKERKPPSGEVHRFPQPCKVWKRQKGREETKRKESFHPIGCHSITSDEKENVEKANARQMRNERRITQRNLGGGHEKNK